MFHPLLRTIKILFKKYMGKYINEELQLDQFTGMGLKNLTLKADAINKLFDPSVPFVLESASIGLFKLELRELTLIIDKVNITLKFKTLEQYNEFRKNYKKIQITAEKLEKLKEACMRDLTSQTDFSGSRNTDNVSQEELSQDLLKQILSKLKLQINNVCIRLEVPLEETTHISIFLSRCQIRMRKIVLDKQNKNVDSSIFQQSQTIFNCQDTSTSMTCTIIFMGISVHINSKNLYDPLNFLKETCILSLSNLYDPLLKQHHSYVIVQLKVDVNERLKYRASTELGEVEASFTQQQLDILMKVLLKLQERQSQIASSETSEVTSQSQEDPIEVLPVQHITWTNSIIKEDYLDGVFQQTQPTVCLSPSRVSPLSPPLLSKNNSMEGNQGIEKLSTVLDDISMSQSETNCLDAFDQSQINTSQCYEDSINETVLQNSCYEIPHLVKQINVKDQERGLKELDYGNLIFAFSLKTLVVTVRMDNKPLEGNRWLFSYASDKILRLKQDGLLNILNTQLECDHYVFVMNQTEIKMEKLIQENKTELKIIHVKETLISINQLDLVEVKYGIYQDQNYLKSSESDDDDMSMYSCNEIQDNDDFERDETFHSIYDNKQLQRIIKLSTDEFVQVIDEHILLDKEINIAKQDYFEQNKKYFQIQSILSISQKSEEQLVSSIKLENQITVFLFQPTQQSIVQVSKQAAIKILIQHQGTDSRQIVCINCNKIYFDINVEQIKYFQDVLASCQTSKIDSMKSTSENKSLIQFENNQLNFNLIIQQPNLINMYFMQLLSESKMLNHQIQLNLKKNSILYYSFTTQKILCQIQSKSKYISFEMAKIDRSQMNHLCEITRSFQIYHQEILSLLTKEIQQQCDQQSKLQPLIKLSNHLDVNKVTIGLPIVIINVQAESTSFIDEIQQFMSQLGSKKQVNQQSSKVTELLIDELKVFVNGSEQPPQMRSGVRTINYRQSYQQRVGLHATKVNVSSTMNHEEKTVELIIYNLVLWDTQRYNSCSPKYGSLDQSNQSYLSQHQQHLAYRSAKYKVETVVLYKQDRCNREKFGNLINENEMYNSPLIFQKIDQSVEEIPLQKKIHSCYINPEFQQQFTRIHRPHCILSLKLNQEQDNIKVNVDVNYAILTLDQQIKDTIDFLQTFKPKEKQSQVPQKNKLILVCRLQNVWLSVFPIYNRKMLLKQFIERKGHIQRLSSENCDQYYYSWIRAVMLINNFVMQIDKDQQLLIKSTLDKVELYLKNTSAPNMPYSNPVLLIQPKKFLYVRNRKISDAFQIDNDRQALLDSLNFHKVAFIASSSCSVDLSERVCVVNPQNQFKRLTVTIQLQRICFKLRRDSLKALMFLVQMDHQRIQTNTHSSRKGSEEHLAEHATTNPKLDIFTQQEVESPITHEFKQMHQLIVTVDRLEVHLRDGFQFPKEIFSIANEEEEEVQDSQVSQDTTVIQRINQEKESLSHLTGYEIYHLDYSDSTDTDLEVEKMVKKNYMNTLQLVAINLKSDFKYESNTYKNLLTIENMYVQDDVKLSKFSRVFAKESNTKIQDAPENMLTVDFLNRPNNARIPSIQLTALVHPIRVCIGGATFEFLYQYLVYNCQWECPQSRYFARLEKDYQNYLAIESSLVKAVVAVDNNILLRKLSRKALIKLANQENYDLVIQHHHPSRHIHVDQIFISKITITISYDGSGIAVNSMLKGLIWFPSYNNLQLILKPASLKNTQFDKQTALLKDLIEQYVEYIHQNKQFIQAVFLENKALKNVSDILWGFQSLVQSTIKEGFLVGISVGSIPLMKALADELLYLAKKPFDLVQTVSDGVGLKPFSKHIIKPMSQVLQNIGNHISYDLIPSEFLKQQEK